MPMQRANSKKRVLLDFSPWILAVACILLLLLLGVFAVSNYQREKTLILEALNQKGLTLMRFINSAARESLRDTLRGNAPQMKWEEHVQGAMEQAVEQPGVEFVLMLDSAGNVLSAAGDPGQIELKTAQQGELIRQLSSLSQGEYLSKIVGGDNGTQQKFQLAAWLRPPDMMMSRPGRGAGRMQMMRRFAQHPQYTDLQEELNRLGELRPLYLVQIDIELFNTPLKRQLLQIIILLVVIVLVGTGGTLAFLALKGLKGSQQRLGTMRAFTDIVIASLPVGLIATDSGGIVQVCNYTAGALLEKNRDEVLGQSVHDCLIPELARMFAVDGNHSGQQRHEELSLSLNSGVTRIFHLTSLLILDEDARHSGVVLLIRDMTDVRGLEKSLQRSERMAALGKMAAGVAHELRNPLSSIKGLAVLLQSKFSGQSKEAATAEILVREVERLNRSIGELLDYAKPGQLSVAASDLNEIIKKTVSLIEADAQSCNVEIHLDLADSLPKVDVDRDKMKQVLLNLFLNAIQAMEDGGQLSIASATVNERVVVSVRDNGTGISAENLSRVFDPYFTTKNDGTGLGLAMSLKIIEEHGGEMKLTSEYGEWTEVCISL